MWRIVAALIVIGAIGTGVPAVAQEEGTSQTTTADQEGTVTTQAVPEPAVPVTQPVEEPEQPAWTYRFLVPTALLIGVLTVLGVIIGYFVKVTRSRYRVVE